MVDIDAAIGYVVAHGDPVERARLSYLRTGTRATESVLERIESGQTAEGGWPASGESDTPSVDATCFRLAELGDLGGLGSPQVDRALVWLAKVQRPDGTWQEDDSLADQAPAWALPGDPEATLYLTAVAGFWMTVVESETNPRRDRPARYPGEVASAARFVAGALRPDGTWPSFLAVGWHAAGLLHDQQFFYESARVQMVLGERLGDMSPADVANMAAALRRVHIGDDWLVQSARKRLAETQRSDGGWDSDEGPVFDVNTTLTAIRACR